MLSTGGRVEQREVYRGIYPKTLTLFKANYVQLFLGENCHQPWSSIFTQGINDKILEKHVNITWVRCAFSTLIPSWNIPIHIDKLLKGLNSM